MPAPSAESPPGAAIGAKLGESDLGQLLASTDGLTLYGFTNDVRARSSCYGTCAELWPPVIVDEDWTVGPGLDAGIFATTVRNDGSLQLVAGKWPLYTYGGDAAPGDVTGQGSGGVWFAVGVDGKLINGDAPAGESAGDDDDRRCPPTRTRAAMSTRPPTPRRRRPRLRRFQPRRRSRRSARPGSATRSIDADGLTLYGFTNDADGVPTCEGDCAGAWPPLLVDGEELPAGLDPAVFSVVSRSDGSHQLKAGAWPLYRFAGDAGARRHQRPGLGRRVVRRRPGRRPDQGRRLTVSLRGALPAEDEREFDHAREAFVLPRHGAFACVETSDAGGLVDVLHPSVNRGRHASCVSADNDTTVA